MSPKKKYISKPQRRSALRDRVVSNVKPINNQLHESDKVTTVLPLRWLTKSHFDSSTLPFCLRQVGLKNRTSGFIYLVFIKYGVIRK